MEPMIARDLVEKLREHLEAPIFVASNREDIMDEDTHYGPITVESAEYHEDEGFWILTLVEGPEFEDDFPYEPELEDE